MDLLKDIINLLTSIVICGTAIWGICAWRRELKGKKQIELAEEVLSSFYEARDILKEIRNPFSDSNEGKTRKRNENETEEESDVYDQAFIVFERYHKRSDSINKWRSLKYRYMTLISNGDSKYFDEMLKIFNEILVSAQMLGSIYWTNKNTKNYNEDQNNVHLENMTKHQNIIWDNGIENNGINKRVDVILSNIEKELSKILLLKK